LPLRLHDVDDGVRFAGAIAARSRLKLSYHDAEDLRQYLVTELWLLSTRYDPASSVSFSTFAGTTLRLRVTDWQRQRFGRTKWKFAGHTYERPRPSLVPFDAELDGALASGTGDPADGGDLELAGVLGAGDCQRARDFATLGLGTPR
jgi:sigma-70-like protein